MDAYLWAPVVAGEWRHADLVNDVFTFDDLLDIHEVMAIKAENDYRAEEYRKFNQQ